MVTANFCFGLADLAQERGPSLRYPRGSQFALPLGTPNTAARYCRSNVPIPSSVAAPSMAGRVWRGSEAAG